jgi:VWFA-related protein
MLRTRVSTFMRQSLLLALMAALIAQDAEELVFRSDTTLVRVDVQVLDQDNRTVTGLHKESFVLREQGKAREIKNFAAEELPIDLLFLVDVSGSMRPHVERMAAAAHSTLPSLREEDRMAVMVFDRNTRLRMPLRPGSAEGRRELDNVLRTELFNNGTDITRALYDAARFMKKQGRKEARRAIVMLTDDMTGNESDTFGAVRALNDAETVMSVLLVPAATPRGMARRRSGGWGNGGRWGGVTIGIPGVPGGPGRGGPGVGPRLTRAGSDEIARESGGDSMPADAASALELTLKGLRQRYSLYFNLPAGVHEGDVRNVAIALEARAKQMHPLSTLRYRRTYIAAATSGAGAPEEEHLELTPVSPQSTESKSAPRRRTVDGSSSRGPSIVVH